MSVRPSRALLLLVLLAGVGLRLLGIGWGLPGRNPASPPFHPDEPPTWTQAPKVFTDPDPVAFAWGGVLYLRTANLARRLAPAGEGYRETLLLLRLGNLLYAAAAAWLVAGLGLRLAGPAAGTTAAALFLLFPGPVLSAHYARPEALLVLLVTASLSCAARFALGGRRAWFFAGSVLAGLACATSLWGGMALGGLAGAWLEARPAGASRLSRARLGGLALLPAGAVLGYLLGSVETLLFWESFRLRWEQSRAAHRGGFAFPAEFLLVLPAFAFGAVSVLLAAAGLVLSAARRRRGTWVLGGFLVAAALLLGGQRTRMMRYVAALAPVVAILAARTLHSLPRARGLAVAAALLLTAQLSLGYVLPMAFGTDPRFRAGSFVARQAGPSVGITRSFRGDETYVPRFPPGARLEKLAIRLYEDFDPGGAIRDGPEFVVTTDYARRHARGEAARGFFDLLDAGSAYRLVREEGPPWRPLSLPALLGAPRPDDLLYVRATFEVYRRN